MMAARKITIGVIATILTMVGSSIFILGVASDATDKRIKAVVKEQLETCTQIKTLMEMQQETSNDVSDIKTALALMNKNNPEYDAILTALKAGD